MVTSVCCGLVIHPQKRKTIWYFHGHLVAVHSISGGVSFILIDDDTVADHDVNNMIHIKEMVTVNDCG